MCIGTMFTNDIVLPLFGHHPLTDRQKLWTGRGFVLAVVIITWLLSLAEPRKVFELGVWCFSGFGSLFPLVVAAVYWRRATKAGAIACVLTTAVTWWLLFMRADFGKAHEDEALVWGMMPVAVIFAASALAMTMVSLMTRPPSEATVRKFIPEIKT
jgi:SSS family solute:Na+ symporter